MNEMKWKLINEFNKCNKLWTYKGFIEYNKFNERKKNRNSLNLTNLVTLEYLMNVKSDTL